MLPSAELLHTGVFRPVIDRSYPLAQIVEAYRYVGTGQKIGNVLVTLPDGTNIRSSDSAGSGVALKFSHRPPVGCAAMLAPGGVGAPGCQDAGDACRR